MTKILPFLWFENFDATEVASYYKSIFGNNFSSSTLEKISDTPSGNVQLMDMQIFDQKMSIMSAGKHDSFNDSFSFVVYCKDQAEIDMYWDAITKDGKPSQCGWCMDKYGLRWQIIPENMQQLTSTKEGVEKMLKMTKIVISEF
jgi:predicted 3-demethylubiquinone-9 3-methyltransferase (glyoxalase superfamily)